jgi:ABC-type nitrate/sulfonate/bicarbonate transport system permease component
MTRALQSFRTDRLFAAIWIVMLMSLGAFKLVDGVGGRLTPWLRRRQRA